MRGGREIWLRHVKHASPRKNLASRCKKGAFPAALFSLLFFPFSATMGKKKKGGRRMEKQIPFQKLSKKKQREENLKHRNTWGPLNPVTRRPENPKAYNRRKAQKRMDDPRFCVFSFWGKAPDCFPSLLMLY